VDELLKTVTVSECVNRGLGVCNFEYVSALALSLIGETRQSRSDLRERLTGSEVKTVAHNKGDKYVTSSLDRAWLNGRIYRQQACESQDIWEGPMESGYAWRI
jgi:hypothetical protein